jgi:hypothetical protein
VRLPVKEAAGSLPTPATSTGNPGLYDCLLVCSRNVEFATVMSCPSKSLIGADIGDTYKAELAHGMLFNRGLVVTPAFNTPSDYRALLLRD